MAAAPAAPRAEAIRSPRRSPAASGKRHRSPDPAGRASSRRRAADADAVDARGATSGGDGRGSLSPRPSSLDPMFQPLSQFGSPPSPAVPAAAASARGVLDARRPQRGAPRSAPAVAAAPPPSEAPTAAPAGAGRGAAVPVHHEVVRNKAARAKMDAITCPQCRGFFSAAGGVMSKEAIEACHRDCGRHRVQQAKDRQPDTPDSFWNIGFDDTQEET